MCVCACVCVNMCEYQAKEKRRYHAISAEFVFFQINSYLFSHSPRHPSISNSTIIFESEGDLFRLFLGNPLAVRLTTSIDVERNPYISPDGDTLIFSKTFSSLSSLSPFSPSLPLSSFGIKEVSEVFLMPLSGGLIKRMTWHGTKSDAVGWTKNDTILYRVMTPQYESQLYEINVTTGVSASLPMRDALASVEIFTEKGVVCHFYVRASSSCQKTTFRGECLHIWKYCEDKHTASLFLPEEIWGVTKNPMVSQSRLYFLSDRSGVMNLWSVDINGTSEIQITDFTNEPKSSDHSCFGIRSASLDPIVPQIAFDMGMSFSLLTHTHITHTHTHTHTHTTEISIGRSFATFGGK